MQIEHSVFIKRPLTEVEAYLTDISNDSEWQEDVMESAITTEGGIGEGTAGYEVRSVMGFPMRTEWIVTGHNPGKSYTFASRESMIPYEGTVEFSAESGGTRVAYHFTMKPEGVLGVLDPLIAFAFTPRFRKNLENLRALLESRA
ncbi:SRPBCC family protein [Prosthecochloris sp. SCSIO W1103]|uniref:SRPBCC family protein n=1 Tax=Prosthecochloris sp. SCSIO W1103 TaxID=2992244 RepID=UPI00223D5284|nr:SRPBCC family protein [Prosthecochloris sp. SCSIO W1103]UZJ37621.1 SRPBCC family protein [Prosthecochloris sp. SCSIO W1103]